MPNNLTMCISVRCKLAEKCARHERSGAFNGQHWNAFNDFTPENGETCKMYVEREGVVR